GLIERHREPWAAVGQAICNGNPQTMRSWTNLFLDYGPWTDPHPGGAVRELPTHNSSFKRAELLACGERLPELLRYSEAINAVLRGRGGQLYLEPRARTFHVNVSRATSWVVERSAAGRAYAASRAATWPAWRRAALAYAGESYGGVVGDGGGRSPLEDVVEPRRERMGVQLVAQARAGPGAARNAGVARAGGELIAFTDDDCRPRPDWLRRLAERF